MQDLSIGVGDSKELHCAEGSLVEIDSVGCTVDINVGDNRVAVAFRSQDPSPGFEVSNDY